jgi:hypothetical protein
MRNTMETRGITIVVERSDEGVDDSAQGGSARFSHLPERIPFEAMVAGQPASPRNPVGDGYAAEASWRHGACVALDAGI